MIYCYSLRKGSSVLPNFFNMESYLKELCSYLKELCSKKHILVNTVPKINACFIFENGKGGTLMLGIIVVFPLFSNLFLQTQAFIAINYLMVACER